MKQRSVPEGRRLVALAVLPLLFACATPLLHPLRVPSTHAKEKLAGLVAEAGTSFQIDLVRASAPGQHWLAAG